MTTITAECILKSQSMEPGVKPVSTLLLRYPRIIHSEFMTHRVFSRNAASSRAIPVSRLIQDVLDDPFVPLHWGAEQKGMQADFENDALVPIEVMNRGRDGWEREIKMVDRETAWLHDMRHAVERARVWGQAGYHKQMVNRKLEEFAHITVVCTATDWENFFALRDHPDAEPHIQILAREMRKAIADAETHILQPGEWHLPFVNKSTIEQIEAEDDVRRMEGPLRPALIKRRSLHHSAACCASTSYKTVEGFEMTTQRAMAISDKLIKSSVFHASPFEHQAKSLSPRLPADMERNLKGYVQQRTFIEQSWVPS